MAMRWSGLGLIFVTSWVDDPGDLHPRKEKNGNAK